MKLRVAAHVLHADRHLEKVTCFANFLRRHPCRAKRVWHRQQIVGGGTGVGGAEAACVSSFENSSRAALNSFTARPNPRASSGSFFEPKNSNKTKRITNMSGPARLKRLAIILAEIYSNSPPSRRPLQVANHESVPAFLRHPRAGFYRSARRASDSTPAVGYDQTRQTAEAAQPHFGVKKRGKRNTAVAPMPVSTRDVVVTGSVVRRRAGSPNCRLNRDITVWLCMAGAEEQRRYRENGK